WALFGVVIEGMGSAWVRRLRVKQCGGPADWNDQGNTAAVQVRRQYRQPIILTVGPAVLHRHVLALDITDFVQTLMNCSSIPRVKARLKAHRENRPRASPVVARMQRVARWLRRR